MPTEVYHSCIYKFCARSTKAYITSRCTVHSRVFTHCFVLHSEILSAIGLSELITLLVEVNTQPWFIIFGLHKI